MSGTYWRHACALALGGVLIGVWGHTPLDAQTTHHVAAGGNLQAAT
jgi:hypothetical protein